MDCVEAVSSSRPEWVVLVSSRRRAVVVCPGCSKPQVPCPRSALGLRGCCCSWRAQPGHTGWQERDSWRAALPSSDSLLISSFPPLQVVPDVASTGFLHVQAGVAQLRRVKTWLWKWTPGVPKMRFGCVETLEKTLAHLKFCIIAFQTKETLISYLPTSHIQAARRKGICLILPLMHIFKSKSELPVKGHPQQLQFPPTVLYIRTENVFRLWWHCK